MPLPGQSGPPVADHRAASSGGSFSAIDSSNLPDGFPLVNGRYTVSGRLGAGGMGVVYLVTDHHLRDKLFALKALSRQFAAEPGAADSLLAEVLTAQALHHPNIIAVYDTLEDLGGLFIKMEFVEGRSLREIQKSDGPQPYDRVVEWMIQACDGLAYAHDQHVIHADIKPANMMLTSSGEVKIADFGLSVTLEEHTHYSLGGLQAGTVNYMSPEQFLGLRVSRRTDVYSMGATMYALLNGSAPFRGAGLQYRLVHQPPEPLEDVPAWLNDVVMACLAKQERERPDDMRRLKRMLMRGTATISSRFELPTLEEVVAFSAPDAVPATPASETVPLVPGDTPSEGVLRSSSGPDTLADGAFRLLGEAVMRCPNNVEGVRTFSLPVYRCEPFAKAVGLGPDDRAPDVEFVMLPPSGHPGYFAMGSPPTEARRGSDEQLHVVTISRRLLLARTAVSQRVYRALEGSGAPDAGEELLPMTGRSWNEVVQWASHLGLRLPSEAEWEFACRAGTSTPFVCGHELSPAFANFDANYPYGDDVPRTDGRERTVAVDAFGMNAFGLFQMHGNVCEWVADAYCGDYSVAPTDGSPARAPGYHAQRVIRGGSWTHLAHGCRSAARFPAAPGFRSRLIGLRPALSLDVSPDPHPESPPHPGT